jgi:antirestriction protein
MSNFRVWFGSLAAYNAGRLVGCWVSLPADDESLRSLYNRYSNNGQHDVFIADYEAPIKVGEYDCIFKLNDIAAAYTDLTDDDQEKLLYLLGNGYGFDEAMGNLENVIITPYRSYKEMAEAFVDDGLYGEIPKHLESYIDYEAIGRDLKFSGQYDLTDDGYIVENIH